MSEEISNSHSWVHEPILVTIEYSDGRPLLEKVMPAIAAKALNDRYWVDKRLGSLDAASILSFTIEDIQSLAS